LKRFNGFCDTGWIRSKGNDGWMVLYGGWRDGIDQKQGEIRDGWIQLVVGEFDWIRNKAMMDNLIWWFAKRDRSVTEGGMAWG